MVYVQEGVASAEVTSKVVVAGMIVHPVDPLRLVDTEKVEATSVNVEVYHQSSDAFRTFRVAPWQYLGWRVCEVEIAFGPSELAPYGEYPNVVLYGSSTLFTPDL